jgi:hypothetical protein
MVQQEERWVAAGTGKENDEGRRRMVQRRNGVPDGTRVVAGWRGGMVPMEKGWVAAGTGMESTASRREWCYAELVQREERRSWQDGEAEWCNGKNAGCGSTGTGSEKRRIIVQRRTVKHAGRTRGRYRSWREQEAMGEARRNGATGRTLACGRYGNRSDGEETRMVKGEMVGWEERRSWHSGRYRMGEARRNGAGGMVRERRMLGREERKSWQVQDGRSKAERCERKHAGKRQV